MVIVPRIAAVSYLDTIPFEISTGSEHAGDLRAELLVDAAPPSVQRISPNGKADIALLPAGRRAAGWRMRRLVTEYCIGAAGPVRTVALACATTPIEEARRVSGSTPIRARRCSWPATWLAPHGGRLDAPVARRCAIRCACWGTPQPGDAFLLIGDKVFDHEGRFAYSYDLAAEWKKATRLPFAFAVWVARKGTAPDLTEGLQHALTFGIEHTYEAILEHGFDNKPYDAYAYLTQNIDYIFDNQKHKALQKFWDSGIKVTPRANPG